MALRDNDDEMLKKARSRVDEFPVICHQSKQHTRTHSSNSAPTISSIALTQHTKILASHVNELRRKQKRRAREGNVETFGQSPHSRTLESTAENSSQSQQKVVFVLRLQRAHIFTLHTLCSSRFCFLFSCFLPASFILDAHTTRSHSTANEHCRVTQTFAFYRDSSVCSSFTLGSDRCNASCAAAYALLRISAQRGRRLKCDDEMESETKRKEKRKKCSNSLCCPFHLSRAKKNFGDRFPPKNNIQYRLIELNET